MNMPTPASPQPLPLQLPNQFLGARWSRYSAAALGGLAGTLAGFEATQAALIIVPVSHTLPDAPGSPPSVTLDLDGDGTTDVGLLVFSASLVSAQGLNGASLAGTIGSGGFFYPTALRPNQSVNPTLLFSGNSAGAPNSFGTLVNSTMTPGPGMGNWVGGHSGYLGVRFSIGSDTHFGWVHLTWDPTVDELRIDQLAHEDQPNTAALVVPEPSILSLLALGAAGLRRRRQTLPV